jgi:hypothetical protein
MLSVTNEKSSLKKEFKHHQIQPNLKNSIIEFSNTAKITHKTKNFIVNHNGFPLRNKEFNVCIDTGNDTQKPLTLPLFKTNDVGLMQILVKPIFDDNGNFNKTLSGYQNLKFSNRLGFVHKDTKNYNCGNIFYRKNYIAKYIDLGISVHFLRTMIQKSHQGDGVIDGSKSPVIHNWFNTSMGTDDIKKEYKKFNTHTERTAKALKYTEYTNHALVGLGVTGITAGAIIATAGLAAPVIVGIGGGIFAGGSTASIVSKQMESQAADISRLRDTEKSAKKTLKLISLRDTVNFKN